MITSEDGAHRFYVDAFTGVVYQYRRLSAKSSGTGAVAPEDLVTREREVIGALFPTYDMSVMKRMSGHWYEVIAPDMLSANTLRLELDAQTTKLTMFVAFHYEPRLQDRPALNVAHCQERALAVVGRWAGIEEVRANKKLLEAYPDYSFHVVGVDSAGAQRLICRAPLIVSCGSGRRDQIADQPVGDGATGRSLGAFVDSVTGECFPSDSEFALPYMVDDESVPRWMIGDELFGGVGPVYPPRVRARVPYFYVGYLDSKLWRGSVREGAGNITVNYDKRVWRLSLDNRRATVDGRTHVLRHAPLRIGGRTYVSADAIEAITGWHVEYSAKENTVRIHSSPVEKGTPPR